MEQTRNEGMGLFDVIMDKQTYLNMVYLMLAFPLGIFYFIYITAGFALGIGLIPVFIGIPVLYAFIKSVKWVMRFERKLAYVFLGMRIGENSGKREKGIGMLVRFKDELFSAELWKSLIYLNLKFFLGILVFVLCVSLASLSLGLIAAPILYQIAEYEFSANASLYFNVDGIQINSLLGFLGINATPEQEMLIFMLLGVFIGLTSLHLFNKTAYLMGTLLRVLSPSQIESENMAP